MFKTPLTVLVLHTYCYKSLKVESLIGMVKIDNDRTHKKFENQKLTTKINFVLTVTIPDTFSKYT